MATTPSASSPRDDTHQLPTRDRIALLEAQTTAKEVASKYLGKNAVPWIVLLVGFGVGSSHFLDVSALPAVIGLTSTAVMALIAMLTGITGTKEGPEFIVIRNLIERLADKKPLRVSTDGDHVVVTHGEDVIQKKLPSQEEKL